MTIVTAPSSLLRPALEAAVQVARAGEAATPAQPAPAMLRRYLRFARLPSPALDVARRVLDEDEAFRKRVIDALSPAEVGEASWLWLTRPDGWESQLEQLRKREQEREHNERDQRTERDAQRRLVHAEDRARRAEALAVAHANASEALRDQLARERDGREAAEDKGAGLVEQLRTLADQRNAAVRRLKEVESELARRSGELREARQELRARGAQLAEASATIAGLQAGATSPASAPVVPSRAPETVAAARPIADSSALAGAVGRAAKAADSLSAALATASALLQPSAASAPPPLAPLPVDRPVRHGRVPTPLPPGILDDTVEAADHLMRVRGAVLLVDGYNISHTAWSAQPIAVQRTRLVDALAELHARTGVTIEVVFDGGEPSGPVVPAAARAGVRVRFSPPDVEADDVVLERIDLLPLERPVVVASSDGRVRDGARRSGANVVSSSQLLGALRR